MVDAMLRGQLAPERLAHTLSEGTARLYGLYPRKGALQVGSDADFTLVDPEGSTPIDQTRLHSKQPLSPWHGRTLRGAIRLAILRGQVIARDGEPVGEPRGRLVRAVHVASPPAGDLDFTAELDGVVGPDVAPATTFAAEVAG
jgi:N-acyl-D-aspartate/D-glutamate deacylase